MRVLFADDEPDFLAPLLKRLARRGIDAVGVGSGEEALEAVAGQLPGAAFDAVVLDVKMPGMGGLAALAELKRKHPALPVLLLTAHADLQDAIAGLEGGAFCHLMKPVELDTLIWRLQDAHEQRLLERPGDGGA